MDWPGAVSRGLLFLMTLSFVLVVFLVLLLTISFLRLILSFYFLGSLVSEALFALSFSFLCIWCC